MIICLIGHSSSGKSTIEKELVKKGYENIISYTTRPIRPNEENGKDYHFISEERFQQLLNKGFFHEVAQYRDWYYGISLADLEEGKDYIAVVTVHGFNELKKHTNDIIAIHILVPERERVIRQLKRGDDVDEVIRRIHTDRNDFKDVIDISEFVVKNQNLDESISQVLNIINIAKQRG